MTVDRRADRRRAPGRRMQVKRVQVTYTQPLMFLGPIAGWFGGTFTSANLTAVAVMRTKLALDDSFRTFSGVKI